MRTEPLDVQANSISEAVDERVGSRTSPSRFDLAGCRCAVYGRTLFNRRSQRRVGRLPYTSRAATNDRRRHSPCTDKVRPVRGCDRSKSRCAVTRLRGRRRCSQQGERDDRPLRAAVMQSRDTTGCRPRAGIHLRAEETFPGATRTLSRVVSNDEKKQHPRDATSESGAVAASVTVVTREQLVQPVPSPLHGA